MTTEQILKYVPKSKLEAVADAFQDDDGIWIYLKNGWEAERMGGMCGCIHEDTIKELRWQIAGIRRVEPIQTVTVDEHREMHRRDYV